MAVVAVRGSRDAVGPTIGSRDCARSPVGTLSPYHLQTARLTPRTAPHAPGGSARPAFGPSSASAVRRGPASSPSFPRYLPRLARSCARRSSRWLAAFAGLVALALLGVSPARAAVCPGDSAPSGAFWTACLTIGHDSGLSTYGYDATPTPTTGALTDTDLTVRGSSHTIKTLHFQNVDELYLLFAPSESEPVGSSDWVLQVGSTSLEFSNDERSQLWTSHGMSPWDASDVGRKVSVSLRFSPTADLTPPVLDSASIDGTLLTLTFSERLSTFEGLSDSAFTVRAGGASHPVAALPGSHILLDSGRPHIITFRIARAPLAGERVTLSYRRPSTGVFMRDAKGNALASFAGSVVTNANTARCDGVPSRAFWSACLTVGASVFPPGDTGWGFQPGVYYAASLSSTSFSVDGRSYTVDALFSADSPGAGLLSFSFTRDPRPFANGWTLQVGNVSYDLGLIPTLGDGNVAYGYWLNTHTFFWAGLTSFPKSSVGQPITVSLRKTERQRPVLQSAAIEGKALTLTYNEALNHVTLPPVESFAVRVGGASRAVSSVAIDPADPTLVTLTLPEAVVGGDVVTLSYTPPALSVIDRYRGRASNALQDLSANPAAAFSARSVTNDSDPCPTGQPAGSVWEACLTIGQRGGPTGGYYGPHPARLGALVPVAVSGDSGAGSVVRLLTGFGKLSLAFDSHTHATTKNWTLQIGGRSLALADAEYFADSRSYRWDHPHIAWGRADAGDKVSVSLRAGSTNHGPDYKSATVNGATLEILFDELLDTASVPPATAFTVTVSGSTRALASATPVAISGTSVILTLSSPVGHGEAVIVKYAKGSTSPIQDQAGRHELIWFKKNVVNETPDPHLRTLVFDPSPLTVDEGSTATYRVKLARAPDAAHPVEVTAAEAGLTSRDTPKLVISPETFTLTTSNWSTGVEVTVRAQRDGDAVDNGATIKHGGERVIGGYHALSPGTARLALTLRDTNAPPRVARPISDQTLVAGASFSYTLPSGTFVDPNGDPLTYTAARSFASWPSWLTFDAATRTFSGTPSRADTGFYFLSVTARDGVAHRGPYTHDEFYLRVYESLQAALDGRVLRPAHLRGGTLSGASLFGARSAPESSACRVAVSVRFTASDGTVADVTDLTAADFSIDNGTLSAPVRSGDGWQVEATAPSGFTGLMRVHLLARSPDAFPAPTGDDDPVTEATLVALGVQGWPASEQVFHVAGGTTCSVVAPNTLASLALEGLTLDPSFAPATLAYTADAPSDTTTTTVRAAAVYGASSVAIDPADADPDADGHQVALAQGETVVSVTVTPASGATSAQTSTVTVTRASSSGVLADLVLVDTADGTDLATLASDAAVTVESAGAYGVRADLSAGATVGSVVLSLSGALAVSRTENVAPYSLYGDRLVDGARVLDGAALPAGAYTLTVTAYAERAGAGDVLGTRSVSFTAAHAAPPPPPSAITGFVLLDASDQSTVASLSDGADIDLGGRSGGSFAIRADVAQDATVGSVALSLSGAKTVSATENIAPYSLWGDHNDGNGGRALDGASLPAGTYTLSATAYAERRASGSMLGTLSLSFEVLAPAALLVADAQAEEGTDATLDFAVTLDRESTGTVTVAYATADGTATAGSDYTATSGTLTFAPGETEKTVSVPVLADDHDEGSETLTLRLSNAQGANIADGEAAGTITNDGAIPEAWLARFGRTVTGQVLDAVEARLAAPRQAGAEMSLAGQALPSWRADGAAGAANSGAGDDARAAAAAERKEAEARAALASMTAWLAQTGPDGRDGTSFGASSDGPGARFESRALTGRDFITGTSFALTGGSAEGGGFASLWGRGSIAGFDGREGALAVDGEVTTGLIGADWSAGPEAGPGRWTAGLALGHSTGTGGWRGADGSGRIEAVLTGLYPYAGMDLTERLTLWAAAGWGAGEVTVTPAGEAGLTGDLTLAMGAAGVRSEVLRPAGGNGLSLAVKGDARFTRTSSDAVRGGDGNLAAADADVWLLRTGVEGSRPFALGDGGATLTPSFEIGLRLDGGDAETGLGADLGGGVAFADPAHGLALDMTARGLVAHAASGFREWGASLSGAWDPRPETDLGFALTLRQSWGAAPAGGMNALLSRETLAGLAANDDGSGRFEAAGRLEGEVAYGTPVLGSFTGTPYAGLGLSGATRDYRLGWRLAPGTSPLDFSLGVEGAWAVPADGAGGSDRAVMVRGGLRW